MLFHVNGSNIFSDTNSFNFTQSKYVDVRHFNLCHCFFSAVTSLTILVIWGYNTFVIPKLSYFNI